MVFFFPFCSTECRVLNRLDTWYDRVDCLTPSHCLNSSQDVSVMSCHLQADSPDSVGAESPAPISILDNRLKSKSNDLLASVQPPVSHDTQRMTQDLSYAERME